MASAASLSATVTARAEIDVRALTISDDVELLNTGAAAAASRLRRAQRWGQHAVACLRWLGDTGGGDHRERPAAIRRRNIHTQPRLQCGRTLAASLTGGNLGFTNSAGLTIGSVLGVDGVTHTAGTVTIVASGASSDLTLDEAVSGFGGGTSVVLVAVTISSTTQVLLRSIRARAIPRVLHRPA